jgi:hypothetical protein
MKDIVRGELELEQYRVVEEPLFPPAKWVSWSRYRPDLLGYRLRVDNEEIVIVECETHPNMQRFRSKKYSSLWFQPSILRNGSLRRILAIPQGKMHSVDMKLRNDWEIWTIGKTRPVVKAERLISSRVDDAQNLTKYDGGVSSMEEVGTQSDSTKLEIRPSSSNRTKKRYTELPYFALQSLPR